MNIPRAAVAVLVALIASPICESASYPAKPVKLIVAFPPGGPTDSVARLIAGQLSKTLGQQVIVDNRPGAGGTIGAALAAKSPADGYTLFLGTTGTLASAPSLYPNLGYHPVKSFVPISLVITAPFVVVVHAKVPAQSLQELISLAKSKPGDLNFGSAGNGHPLHIAGEMFKIAAGVDLVHVPYKGTAPALPDLLAGRIQIMFDVPATFTSFLQSGQLRALAVAGPRRIPQLPDVPTTAEAGLPGYEVSAWFGLVAPAGTPAEIVKRLNAEVRKAVAMKEIHDALANQGLEPSVNSPEEFTALIKLDGAKWARAVELSGAKID
ncbi:MAG: Bug family tripartite tricarboxylate transporter substrate binding protein [Burkholderiales bacterium]